MCTATRSVGHRSEGLSLPVTDPLQNEAGTRPPVLVFPTGLRVTLRPIHSSLSYWSDYFRPDAPATRPGHSTGWLAERLYGILAQRGPVDYWDNAERPVGTFADLFVGHFWAFADLCRENHFDRAVAVYVLSDPVRAAARLRDAATRYGVPYPAWDLPPERFDHQATMERADAVILVGNSTTKASFDHHWHPKITVVNYAPGPTPWPHRPARERRREFVYAATTCGLRKGFLDVIETWRGIDPAETQLHVVGQIEEPYGERLATSGARSVRVHGWIPSTSPRYRELLTSCRFAYIPTWVEGQMGTALEAIAAGCIPITTRECGVDDRVLEHCVLVEPERPEQHREAIATVLDWSEKEYRERQTELRECMERYHTWTDFDERVRKVVFHGE
jgi:glycosyltransferase involved in cell wall biosynthesis